MKKIILFSTFIFFLFSHVFGLELYLGPEIYSMKRWRANSVKQKGRMDGLRAGFDRIKRYGWYVGADCLYANGDLVGRGREKKPILLEVTDRVIEAKIGYTFQKEICSSFFTPYIGYGNFQEKSNFLPPSCALFCQTDNFNYLCLGFLSNCLLFPLIHIGLNFKVDYMLATDTKITHDRRFGEVKLKMSETLQYRLEIPVRLLPSSCLNAVIVPFYEFRHFGGREGYPFNYNDTKFNLFGIRLAASYVF